MTARIESQSEACAHHAGKQRHKQTLGKGEVFNRRLLLIIAHICRAEASCVAYDGYSGYGDTHSAEQHESVAVQQVGTCEERGEECSERRTRAESYALTQSYTEIAHGQTERQSAHTPQHAVDNRQQRPARAPQLPQAAPFGNREQRAEQRKHEPREDALDEPETLPRPFPYLVYWHI